MKRLSWLVIKAVAIVLASCVGAACSSEETDLGSVRTIGQSMTVLEADVLGFENPVADWSVNNGSVLSSSTSSSQASSSLSVVPNGYTQIESVSITAPGDSASNAQIDVQLPASLSWGELRLVLKAPSEGVYWLDVGGGSLTGLEPGAFQTLDFPLSTQARSLIDSSASDLSILVVLNAENVGGAFLLDNLRLGGSSTASSDADATIHFSFGLPKGTNAGQLALSGTDGVVVDSGCSIGEPGSPTAVAGFSPAGVNLAASATIYGDVYSTTQVNLMSQSTVTGDVTASGEIYKQDDLVSVEGVGLQGTAVREIESGWNVQWPENGRGDVTRAPDALNQELIPGAYGKIHLYSRSTLTLRAGTFFIDALTVEPQVHLRIDTSNGPVVIYVKNKFILNEGFEFIGGDESNVLIGYLGTSPAVFEEAIVATVVAPNSVIELRRPASNLPHRGAFLGKFVHVFSDARVLHVPFQFGVLCASGIYDGGQCVGEAAAPTEYVDSEIWLPKGVKPGDFMLGARKNLEIGESAMIAGDGRLITNAAGQTIVRANANIPALATVGGGELDAGAQVNGDLRADAPVTLGAGAGVAGNLDEAAGISPPTKYRLSQTFTATTDGDISIASGRSKIVLPGNYGSFRVSSGGKVYLKSGDYTFREFVVEPAAELVIAPDVGWVRVDVANHLALQGKVAGLGLATSDVIFLYGGSSPVLVAGELSGAVLAPKAVMKVDEGPHVATFYSNDLFVGAHVELTSRGLPWPQLLDDEEVDESTVVVSPEIDLPGALEATSGTTSTITKTDGFKLVVPGRIPVGKGNAGNAITTLGFTRTDGSSAQCQYRGGATAAHPIDLLDIAKGREYHLDSCSDGTSAGSEEEVTYVSVDVEGDQQAGDGTTGVNIPVDKGCEGDLVPPISLAESRGLIENFRWPLLSWNGSTGTVPDYIDGKPSLYYASIYITNEAEMQALDTMLIHWDKRQLFVEEWPEDWENVCGTIDYDHDGEGVWVWAIMPGEVYNLILAARTSSDIEPDSREIFKAVRLLDPPPPLAGDQGSLNVDLLFESGFEYRGLTDLPDWEALGDALYPGGAADLISDGAKWVFNRAKGVLQGIAVAFGFIDRLYGVVDVDLNIDVLLGDLTFSPNTSMQRAWGVDNGAWITPKGARVNFWTTSIRWTNPLPFSRLSQDRMSLGGKVSFKVAKGSDIWGNVSFKRVCIELENRAGFMTTFLSASSVCNDTFTEGTDFNSFEEDSSIKWKVSSSKTRHLTEVTDSHLYLDEVVGVKAKKAKVLIGPNAYVIAGFKEGAIAYCAGYGDLAADLIAGLAGPYTTILANTDILVTDGNEHRNTRGLMTHEYGHYALCDIVRKNAGLTLNEGNLYDLILTLDTVAGGGGNPDPDEEARVVNEAFADFFAMQIAGGVNYSFLLNAVGTVRSKNGGFTFSTGNPGLDTNIFQQGNSANGFAIGRLATMMQDLFDGRPYRNPGPTSGETWAPGDEDPTLVQHRERVLLGPDKGDSEVAAADDVDCSSSPHIDACRTGDMDLEQVMLGGASIRTAINNFQLARKVLGGYRVEAMERGLITTALEETNWCQACLLAAPHFQSFVVNPDLSDPLEPNIQNPYARDLIEACQSGVLADYLGDPPRETLELDAFTCERCPPGTGMGRDGLCVGCPVDQTVYWDGGTICQEMAIDYFSDPNDWCPESFIVDVIDGNGTYPVESVSISVAEDIDDDLSCALSRLTGTVARSFGSEPLDTALSFDIAGSPSNGGGIQIAGACMYPNYYAYGKEDVVFDISGGRLLIQASAGERGVNVKLRANPDCGIVIK